MPEMTKLRKEHISGVLGFKGQNKGQTRFEAAKNPETVMVSGLLTMVRGTGLELTRRHVTLGRPVSKSTASKTSIEVVRVRQR